MTIIAKQQRGFYRNVFAIMIPIMLQNLITHTVTLADTFMVGMLGEQYLAAVTIAATPMFVLMILVFGVQSGMGILVSQYWGKGDTSVINRIIGVAIYCALVVTIAGVVLMRSLPHQILGFVTNDNALVDLGVPYMRITCFAVMLNSISLVYLACHRSMENPRLGAIVLGVSAVFNVFLNWALIFGNLGFPALGIQGAAIATLGSRVVEVLIVIVHAFFNSRFRIKLSLFLRPGIIIFKDFLKYSLPVLLNEALWSMATMMYPVILGHMAGAETNLAAYNLAGNLERVFAVAMFACGGATAVIIGRELGAGRGDSVNGVAKSLIGLGFIIGICSAALLLLARLTIFEPLVYPLFDLSNDAASKSSIMLTILIIMLPLRTLGFTMGIGILRGGGDVKAFMIIDLLTLYAVALPLAFIFGLVLKLGVTIVYSTLLLEEVTKCTLIFLRVRAKKWIKNITRESVGAGK